MLCKYRQFHTYWKSTYSIVIYKIGAGRKLDEKKVDDFFFYDSNWLKNYFKQSKKEKIVKIIWGFDRSNF